MRQRGLFPLFGLCLGWLPWASVPARAQPLLAHYEVRAAGMAVMRVEATLDLDGPRYLVRTRIRTTCLAGVFTLRAQVRVAGEGGEGVERVPASYRGEGVGRGTRRRVAMDWTTPGMPQVSAIEPPNEAEREVVPDAL